MSTYLIPRDYIPPLSRTMKRQLSILYHPHVLEDSDDEGEGGDDTGDEVDDSQNANGISDSMKNLVVSDKKAKFEV